MGTPQLPISAAWGSLVTGGFASGGIPYIDANNFPAIDLNNFYYDSVNKFLQFIVAGDFTGNDSVNIYKQYDAYQLQAVNQVASPWASQSTPGFTVSTSRGTAGVPAFSQNGDYVGQFGAWAYIQTVVSPAVPVYTPVAAMFAYIEGVNVNNNFGGGLHFGCKIDGGVFTDYLTLDNAGNFKPTVAAGASLGKTGFGWSSVFLDFANSGGVGAQVINKTSGRTGIAAGQIAVVVTNSKISATSIVVPVLETVDATAKSIVATPGNGSVTFTLNAACTAQVTISFVVVGN